MWARVRSCSLDHPAAGRRGLAWIVGSFLICPCHLPMTLAVITGVLSGTALATFISGHRLAAGVAFGIAWVFGTWRGIRLIQRAELERPPTLSSFESDSTGVRR